MRGSPSRVKLAKIPLNFPNATGGVLVGVARSRSGSAGFGREGADPASAWRPDEDAGTAAAMRGRPPSWIEASQEPRPVRRGLRIAALDSLRLGETL